MSEPLLSVTDATVAFGGLKAVAGVSISLHAGRVLGLIGPNGAGKTTLFNAVSGLVVLTSGRVVLAGQDVSHLPPHRRALLGVARTFQLGGLIPEMTALENVVLGLDQRSRVHGRGVPHAALRSVALDHLADLGLRQVAERLSGELAAGIRRQVELARALAAQPSLMLLDEPGVGLTEAERAALADAIRTVTGQGVGVLMTDHDTELVFGVADEVAAMNFGRLIAQGTAADVRADPGVIEAYLGGDVSHDRY